MKVQYKAFNLPFKYPFTISRGTKTHQPTLVVSLTMAGITGYGEAPANDFYNVSVDSMMSDIERKKTFIEKFAFTTPGRYWHYLHHLIPNNPFLVCALDMAAWDLYGKLRRQPLYALWNTKFTTSLFTDYTIGIDTVEKMVYKMQANPWPVYKIKMGAGNDLETVETLRKHSNATFRVDANAGWTTGEALQKIKVLAGLGVELIEQPLDKNNWEGMKTLMENSALPLIADESCVSENDVEKCYGYFHGINIKLTKCGGITPALRMIAKARTLNLKVMMGSMNETSLGTAATVHFIPQLDFLDADGPLLLAEDPAKGLQYTGGNISLGNDPGLGVFIAI